jgi:hypothetical protein
VKKVAAIKRRHLEGVSVSDLCDDRSFPNGRRLSLGNNAND